MSSISLDPNVWGPEFWDILFYISFYVNLSKHFHEMHSLFHLLEVMLPCSHCRRHYAVYKKQIPPVTNVKKTDRDSPSIWLWMIHDMVNQNLGKICISYEKLVKKHKSFTCMVSDMNMFDTFVFIWMTSRNNPKVFDGMNLMRTLLHTIRPFKVCQVLEHKLNPSLTYEILWHARNDLLDFYGYESVSLGEMKAMYESAIAV